MLGKDGCSVATAVVKVVFIRRGLNDATNGYVRPIDKSGNKCHKTKS